MQEELETPCSKDNYEAVQDPEDHVKGNKPP